mmetsp:Transcript_2189/g.5031  ORF Transcript_2189/g.5031 Transcript_2189/m.5031 type:complete len:277 (+) Transcript_2189:108-938(+)
MGTLTRQGSMKSVKHVTWDKDWALKEGERETQRRSRIEWKKNLLQKKKNKRRFDEMNRTEEDNQAYDKIQQRWMFDVLKESRLEEVIVNCCADDINSSAQLSLIFKHCKISTDIGFPEGLKLFRESIEWEMFENDEKKLEALLSLWRVKTVRRNFTLPYHFLSSTDTNESENGVNALRKIQDPQLLTNIARMGDVMPKFFAEWIVPHKTKHPALAHKFEQLVFQPQAVDSVPPAQLPGHRTTDTTESDSSTIHPKSSHEDDDREPSDDPSGKSDPD